MSESWIKVGAKCTCIDDKIHEEFALPEGHEFRPDDTLDGLTTGVVYTIEGMKLHPLMNRLVVWLVEIDRGIEPDGLPGGFDASRFRSLVSERDDVAAFEAIAFKPKLDIELEQLEAAWRMSEADEMPAYGTVLSDDADLRWIEEQARKGGK